MCILLKVASSKCVCKLTDLPRQSGLKSLLVSVWVHRTRLLRKAGSSPAWIRSGASIAACSRTVGEYLYSNGIPEKGISEHRGELFEVVGSAGIPAGWPSILLYIQVAVKADLTVGTVSHP